MTILKESDYCVSLWSGGSTKQLAIAPEGAVYADRDFAWRLSSATVELPESDFTALPDYDRIIAPLYGEMRLWHNGVGPLDLDPFELHRFDGGDDTHSEGKCTDYNLMLRKGQWDGTAKAVVLSAGEAASLPLPREDAELLLYCVEGEVTAVCDGESAVLRAGETLRTNGSAELTVLSPARLMAAWAWKL